MIPLTLRPYPGEIRLCESKDEYRSEHKKLFGEDIDLREKLGRMDGHGGVGSGVYLVWACDTPRLAHELSHVILHVFELVGIDPRGCYGEPFCYMLSQLLLDANHGKAKTKAGKRRPKVGVAGEAETPRKEWKDRLYVGQNFEI